LDAKMQATLEAHFATGKKHKRPYHYAAQRCVLDNIKKYQGVEFSVRTYNRKQRLLEDQGFIKRTQRGMRGKDGRFRPGSTLTHLTGKAFNYMAGVLRKALNIFSFYRMPKMAQYRFNTTGYLSVVGKVSGLVDSILSKGSPSGSLSCGLSPPPDPAK